MDRDKRRYNRVLLLGIALVSIIGFAVVFVVPKKQGKELTKTFLPSSPSPSLATQDDSLVTVIAEHLDTPWAIAFLPDKSMLVTERSGRVRLIDENGNLDPNPVATNQSVKEIGEGGLLGITIHPSFSANHYVYLYYTYSGVSEKTLNRVVRMIYKDKTLTDERIIVDNIPGASNHNGGRLKFGPDGFLYITTGDSQNPSLAQNTSSLAGKILRVSDNGASTQSRMGTKFYNTLIYSYGHRNPQGLAWDEDGHLWATEHGRSGIASGYDELNLVESGKNYGWPEIQGNEERQGMVTPKRNSGAATTWAPSGATFLGNSLFFAGLRGQTLYEAIIQNNQVTELREHFKGEFGRIREVVGGPDGMLYITTSNRDGRGNPHETDDKIIRVNPARLR